MIRRLLVLVAMSLLLVAPPASAAPKQVATTFGAAGAGDGELGSTVAGVAVRQSTGDVYVIDAAADRVQRFDADGAYLGQFGTPGTGDGALTLGGASTGLAVDQASGDVYVADTGNNRIQRFSATGVYQSQFGAAGAGDGELAAPVAVAVDPTSHDVYVADRDNNRVQRFSSAGVFEAQLGTLGSGYGELSAPTGVAVDATGAVYVLDSGNARVQRFAGLGAFPSVFAPATLTFSPQALAVDPATGHVFVAQYLPDSSGTQILELTAAGNTVESHGSALPVVGGLDVRATSGRIYGTDLYGSRVLLLDDVVAPEVTTGAATAITATSATVNATINAHGGPPVTYRFELSTDGATWKPMADAGPVTGSGDTPVSAPVTDLQPNTQYSVRVVATPALNPAVTSAPETFTTVATPPSVTTGTVLELADDAAVLSGDIDPQGTSTRYWFEYGLTTAYGSSAPAGHDGDAGASTAPQAVSRRVAGLAAGQTYHYRLVAQNTEGTTEGSDRVFTTTGGDAPAQTADTCANAAFRPGLARSLEDCRAYELASPTTKNGNDVFGNATVQASPDGGAVAFMSTGAFEGSAAAGFMSSYVARRASPDWHTRALAPPQTNEKNLIGGTALSLSEDLSRSLAFSLRALAPGATEGHSNVYFQDDDLGALSYVGGTSDNALFRAAANSGDNLYLGGDRDLRNAFFPSPLVLAQGAVAGAYNLYEATSDGMRVANVLPDGTVGGTIGNSITPRSPVAGVVSRDGAMVFFETDTLYAREDGERTVTISVDHRTGHAGEGAPGRFLAASADGSIVFFTSDSPLTDGSPPDDGERLYRLDRNSDQLTDITIPSIAGTLLNIVDVSRDGAHLYFTSGQDVYQWSAATGVRRIATLGQIPYVEGGFAQAALGNIAVSPSGRYLAFDTQSRLTDDAARSPRCKGGFNGQGTVEDGHCVMAYVYDSESASLHCVSCDPAGTPQVGNARLGGLALALSRYYPRAVLDDGTVFFNTGQRLVAADTDGKTDVYAWRAGRPSLLTPGTTEDTIFGDASVDGRDVFVLTRDRLVPTDRDENQDLYDVRVGGGLAAQHPAPPPIECTGDRCQRLAGPGGAPVTIPSFAGGGDPAPVRRQRVSLHRLSAKQRSALARGRAVTARVGVAAAGTVGVRLTTVINKSSTVLASGRRRATKAGSVSLKLRLSQRGRRELARRGRLSVAMVVTATGARRAAVDRFTLKLNVHKASASKHLAGR
jgi:DNA-binding beta-propeller fold protein YncE